MRNTGIIPEIANNMAPRKVALTKLESHAIVHPVDTNALDIAFGGYLMSLMDEAACVVAFKHAGRKVNTVSIDGVRFWKPSLVGTILNIHACLNRVFKTSMEIGLKITETDAHTNEEIPVARAYFTFVAIDDNGKPVQAPPVEPESDEEKRRFEQALIRRDTRIELAQKLNP
ncbi:MAG: acyl-CoA thioesterase [Fibrobacter sp.]|nr:acyl-CoA thioesterase [Fibrobacter sp.]